MITPNVEAVCGGWRGKCRYRVDRKLMKYILLLALGGGLCAQEAAPRAPLKLWSISVSQMMAAASFDAWSSQRMNGLVDRGLVHENNGLFADARGHYVISRALPIACGTYAGVAIGEYLLIRKFPKLARPFSVLNFGVSGIGLSSGFRNVALYNQVTRQ
jgi:hypothetical protein